jgi:hypothetical protein
LQYEIFHDVLAPAINDWRTRFQVEKEKQEEIARQVRQARETSERILLQEQEESRQRLLREQEEGARKLREQAEDECRQRQNVIFYSVIGTLLLVAIVIGLFGVWAAKSSIASRVAEHEARAAEATAKSAESQARSRELTADAEGQSAVDPELSVILAYAALQVRRLPSAEDALRLALSQSPVRAALREHTAAVTSVAFGPDGQLLLTTSRDGTARVRDMSSGKQRAVLQGGIEGIAAGVFSPEGRLVATADADGTARI